MTWRWHRGAPPDDWHPLVVRMVTETCVTCEHCASPVRVLAPPAVPARGWVHPHPFTDDDGDPAIAWHDHTPDVCRQVRADYHEELTAWTREPLPQLPLGRSPARAR